MVRRATITVWLTLALLACAGRDARGLTPDSPEAKAALAKAMKFLETAEDGRLGAKCLVGLAHLKYGAQLSHPQVTHAIERCRETCQSPIDQINADIYSTGIAIVFLCEADAKAYRAEIVKLLQSLELRQRRAGGWGYPLDIMGDSGDTSMTQYAVLATWTAHHSGIEVKQDSVERVCNWLLRVQDPSGAFGYQGIDPGVGKYERRAQREIRNSLTAAGAGSLYVCSELLKFKTPAEIRSARDDALPPALVPAYGPDVARGAADPVTDRVPPDVLRKAIRDVNAWLQSNYKIDQGDQWNYYHLFALERYHSFREVLENSRQREPRWYTDGVTWLIKTQLPNGSWAGGSDPPADTAFGALFIMRSTRKSIEKTLKRFGDGQLAGGRGLPSDAANVQLKQGKLVSPTLQSQIDELVAVLEQGKGLKLENVAGSAPSIRLSTDEKVRREQLLRLRRLTAASSFEVRLFAVRQLARARDMESVPTLIYALSDPDPRVVRAADEGLRFMARRIDPTPLAEPLTDDDRQSLENSWRKWYASVRPEAQEVAPQAE